MKKIGFIGAYDKTNLIIYISKILIENKFRVLVIDGTLLQKTRYTIPCINPGKSYITSFENIDFAIGFDSIKQIESFLNTSVNNYDFVFIDVDNKKRLIEFELNNSDMNFFVTAFDSYSLKRGLEVVGKLEYKKQMTKILFSRNMDKSEDKYLDFLSSEYSINWSEEKIYFPFENGDESVNIQNQRNGRVSYKQLSTQYKNGIIDVMFQIAPDLKYDNIKKILKNI